MAELRVELFRGQRLEHVPAAKGSESLQSIFGMGGEKDHSGVGVQSAQTGGQIQAVFAMELNVQKSEVNPSCLGEGQGIGSRVESGDIRVRQLLAEDAKRSV